MGNWTEKGGGLNEGNTFSEMVYTFHPYARDSILFIGFLFAPNDPMESNLLARYAAPSAEYPFGTDALGRCILSRILYGGWTTLGIVLGGSLIVFLIGTVIGMVTSHAVMKENALVDGLINAVTAIPPIAYLMYSSGLGAAEQRLRLLP